MAKFVKILTRLVAGVLLLPVVCYLVLLAINWNDVQPSAEALHFKKLLEERKPLAQEDNAFVYITGFDIKRDLEPYSWGLKRLEKASSWQPGDTWAYEYGESEDFLNVHTDDYDEMLRVCKADVRECLSYLSTHEQMVDHILKSESWLLERYMRLLEYQDYQDPVGQSIEAIPNFSGLFDAQWLLLFKVWKLNRQGMVDDAHQLMEKDIAFWRMVMADSELMISKVIATAGLLRNLNAVPFVSAPVRAYQQTDFMPPSLLRPISRSERLMERVLMGELEFARQSMSYEYENFNYDGAEYTEYDELAGYTELEWSILNHFWWALRPFVKRQDSLNHIAHYYREISLSLDLDNFQRYPPAYSEIMNREAELQSRTWLDYGFYNATGNYLYTRLDFPISNYAVMPVQAESIRRAAVLAMQIRAQEISSQLIPAFLEGAELRDPYTGEAYQYDREHHALVFTDLDDEEYGRYSLLH